MIYWLADGISIEDSAVGSFLVSTRPLRMVRLNPALMKLVTRMEEVGVKPESAAEVKVLESLFKSGFVDRR